MAEWREGAKRQAVGTLAWKVASLPVVQCKRGVCDPCVESNGGVVAVCCLFFCLSPAGPHRPLLIYLPAVPWSSIWPSPARVPACCPGWSQTPTPDGAPRAPPLARGSATCPSAPVALAPPRTLVFPRSATVAAAAPRLRPHDPRCCGSHAIHRQRSCRPAQSGPGHRQFPNPGEIAPPGWATVISLPTLPRGSSTGGRISRPSLSSAPASAAAPALPPRLSCGRLQNVLACSPRVPMAPGHRVEGVALAHTSAILVTVLASASDGPHTEERPWPPTVPPVLTVSACPCPCGRRARRRHLARPSRPSLCLAAGAPVDVALVASSSSLRSARPSPPPCLPVSSLRSARPSPPPCAPDTDGKSLTHTGPAAGSVLLPPPCCPAPASSVAGRNTSCWHLVVSLPRVSRPTGEDRAWRQSHRQRRLARPPDRARSSHGSGGTPTPPAPRLGAGTHPPRPRARRRHGARPGHNHRRVPGGCARPRPSRRSRVRRPAPSRRAASLGPAAIAAGPASARLGP